MHIAVDYQSAQGKRTGIGVSASSVCEAASGIQPDWSFTYYTISSQKDLNTPGRILWESVRIPWRAFKSKPDIVYSPGFAPAFFSPVKQVVTVHDLIGMIYPKNLPLAARFYWSYWLPLCVKRASVCVASSESTKNDMVRLLKINPDKIRVVPLDANPIYRLPPKDASGVAKRYALTKPFLVTVGTLEPRKNISKLIDAVRQINQGNGSFDFQIAVCGKGGGEQDSVRNQIQDYGLGDQVKLLGYVSDEDIRDLYHASAGYCIVSMYEGFGLPVLEAMCCGRAGVCSQKSSLPEVASEAAVYVDPMDVASIADGIRRYLTDDSLRTSLNEKALVIASRFSWDKTARQMIDVFIGAVGQSK